jgi:hypothetical protein
VRRHLRPIGEKRSFRKKKRRKKAEKEEDAQARKKTDHIAGSHPHVFAHLLPASRTPVSNLSDRLV